MAATLETIRGGGGSVKVGAVGTIGTLMTREIESSSSTSSPRTPVPCTRSNNGPLKPRKSMTEASSSGSTNSTNHGNTEFLKKTKSHNLTTTTTTTPKRKKQKTPFEEVGNNSVVQRISKGNPDLSGRKHSHKHSYHIPMIGSENIQIEKTPVRDKPMKKGSNIVDVVDVNCGNPGSSLSTRLKKLNFSKLSQSFM